MSDTLPPEFSDEVLKDFCEDIVRCMVVYGGWDEERAQRRLDESGLCAPENNRTEMARAVFFHDLPYFWAMGLIYAHDNPQWFNDPELGLWPPPEEAEQRWLDYAYPHERKAKP